MSIPESKSVQLRIPATSGYLRLCRLNAALLAADLGYTLDELDDLRLAVDEGVNWLVSRHIGSEVLLTMTTDGDALVIQGEVVDDNLDQSDMPDDGAIEIEELLDAVLGATLESYCIETRNGRSWMQLVSRHREH